MISSEQNDVNSNRPMTRAEAIALGLKRYFTGKPCKRGHVTERMVSSRGCADCIKERSPDAKRRYYASDPEKMRERSREWRAAHPERARELDREGGRRYSKTEKARIRRQRFAKKHPDRLRENTRRWREKNPERSQENDRNWRRNNPEKIRTIKRRRRARKLGAGGAHNSKDIAEIRKLQRNRCARCRLSLKGKEVHVDHIIPLARGGTDDRRNLQLLCASCNHQKWACDPIDDMRRLGRLL